MFREMGSQELLMAQSSIPASESMMLRQFCLKPAHNMHGQLEQFKQALPLQAGCTSLKTSGLID